MDFTDKVDEEIDRMTGTLKAYPGLYLMISYHMKQRGSRLLVKIAEDFGEAFAWDREKIKKPVAWLELFHNFTLIHDDIIDGDERRRGQAAVWKKWNINKAILAGDALLAAAALCRESLNGAVPEKEIRDFVLTVMEGEFYDICYEEKKNVPIGEALRMLRQKSGCTIAFLLKTMGMAAGLPKEAVDLLYRVGETAGLSMQIKNDIMNLIETVRTGIPGDIGRGKKTPPILLALQSADGREAGLPYILADGSCPDPKKAALWVLKNGAFDALELAEQYKEEAVGILEDMDSLYLGPDEKRRLGEKIRNDFHVYTDIGEALRRLPFSVD